MDKPTQTGDSPSASHAFGSELPNLVNKNIGSPDKFEF